LKIRHFRRVARKGDENFGKKREGWTVPAPLWVIMPLEDKMHGQRNFVLNVGFGRSPTSVFEFGFVKSDSKIASWYRLALLAGTMSSMKQKQFHQRRLYGCADFQNIVILKYELGLKVAKLLAWFPFRNY